MLAELVKSSCVDVVAVITQPDRPAGRGQRLAASPVKQIASNKIKLYQPEKLRDSAEQILQEVAPELIVVVAYGQFIPSVMLEYPQFKALNVHASLLPKLRGATPIQSAIRQGFAKTGVSIQVMVSKMDAGPLLAQSSIEIDPLDNAASLGQKLSNLAKELLISVIPDYIAGKVTPQPQLELEATYCYIRDFLPEMGQISFELDVDEAVRIIRAFNPNPVAYCDYKEQKIKIFSARIVEAGNPPSKLMLKRVGKSLCLGLHNGWLELLELQTPGKRRMRGVDYLFLV